MILKKIKIIEFFLNRYELKIANEIIKFIMVNDKLFTGLVVFANDKLFVLKT